MKKIINNLSPLNILLGGLLALTLTVHLFSIKRKIINASFQETPLPEKVYIDKYGDRHTLLKTIELNKNELAQLKKENNLLVHKLNAHIKIVVKTDTFFKSNVVMDSNCNFFTEKKDNYLSLSVKGNKDSATFTYQSIDTITYIDFVKYRFLRSNLRTVDIKNKNPYNKITAGQAFVLKEAYTYLSLGPQIGFNPINQKIYLGIGIQFNLLPLIKK